jgi:uncharacterized protein (DUF1800 family)
VIELLRDSVRRTAPEREQDLRVKAKGGPMSAADDTDTLASDEAHTDEQEDGRLTSRRGLFKFGAALAAASLIPTRKAAAQRIVRPRPGLPGGGAPSTPPPLNATAAVRLVNRITFGATDAEVKRATQMGFNKYLEYQLNYKAIDDTAVNSFVTTTYPTLAMPADTLYAQPEGTVQAQLQQATLYRAAFSTRQLYERMVEFWSDHFNISIRKVGYLKTIDDRDVIRANALGKFKDLLLASAHSSAMLEYLDNTRSSGTNPNQNYARELMELHTLGVDGGYTQDDVAQVSLCLTGWTIAGRGGFQFVPNLHAYTAKTVLGQAVPDQVNRSVDGVKDGDWVLTKLLAHPSTAKFVSTKMARYLLRYDPPQSLIDSVAAVFTSTGGDIPSMIRAILKPTNLDTAPTKMKRPFHLVASAIRATSTKATNMNYLVTRSLSQMGQVPYFWEEPNGYPDDQYYWSGNIIPRWNFATDLTTRTNEFVLDMTLFTAVNTPAGITDTINKALFGGDMTAKMKGEVTSYLGAATLTLARAREAVALALSSTDFQWY